jgi:hypothetical protein
LVARGIRRDRYAPSRHRVLCAESVRQGRFGLILLSCGSTFATTRFSNWATGAVLSLRALSVGSRARSHSTDGIVWPCGRVLAGVPPGSSQSQPHRGAHLVLQTPDRDRRGFNPRRVPDLSRVRRLCTRGSVDFILWRGGRVLLPLKHPGWECLSFEN